LNSFFNKNGSLLLTFGSFGLFVKNLLLAHFFPRRLAADAQAERRILRFWRRQRFMPQIPFDTARVHLRAGTPSTSRPSSIASGFWIWDAQHYSRDLWAAKAIGDRPVESASCTSHANASSSSTT
jgi:hypothetical protein